MSTELSRWQNWERAMGGIAAVFMAASVMLGIWKFGQAFSTTIRAKEVQAFVLGLWVILPPSWFRCEFFLLYRKVPEADRPKLDDFKYGQEQSAKIWLALITVLTVLYFLAEHNSRLFAISFTIAASFCRSSRSATATISISAFIRRAFFASSTDNEVS
jgi:hypothetical protein